MSRQLPKQWYHAVNSAYLRNDLAECRYSFLEAERFMIRYRRTQEAMQHDRHYQLLVELVTQLARSICSVCGMPTYLHPVDHEIIPAEFKEPHPW